MKVLHIINALNMSGAQKLLADSLVSFHKKGWEVDLFPLNPVHSYLYEIIEDIPNLNVIKGNSNLNSYNPYHILRIARIIHKYDIIHVHLFPALYWVSIANVLQRRNRKKRCLIYTEHNTTNRRRNSIFFKAIDRLLYKQYDSIVGISEGAKIALQEHLGNSYTNILAIDNGIDLDNIVNATGYTKKELGFRNDDILIIQVSALRYPKDHKTVIRSLHKLKNNRIHFLLAGEGVKKEEIIEFTKELNLANNVHLLGVRKDVPRLLKTVDIVILSSAYEGLSLASVEGMASGKPFIASDVPGLTEVTEGAGLLFPHEDADKLAQIISLLIENPDHYNLIIKQCMKRAQVYDINLMINKYIEVYNNCSKKTVKNK
jgi:glycosyltransferase involved in cell wall biosynthesis